MEFSPLSYRQILKTWWPLAFSWLLMSVEIPALSAVIARLANPEINLAAYGGIVFPLALIIEAPVIMLLGASVALCKHRQSYRLIWKYMVTAGAVLTCLHLLIALSPLYYWVTEKVIGAPAEIVEPARVGLVIMTPWTWSIAYRRFQQGVLIRYGHSRAVGTGTLVRLSAVALTLLVGYAIHTLPGVAVGAMAQAFGVMSEALYAGWRVRPVLQTQLREQGDQEPLTWRGFADFYVPLALTSMISLLWQPVGSAALSRMPAALESLAVWPVLSGLTSLLRSPGTAYNEVTVALLERHQAVPRLRSFAIRLAVIVTVLHLLMVATPLAAFYFLGLSALPVNLARLAQTGLWIALPMSGLSVFQNWFQGSLLYGKQTRAVPESVVIFFATVLLVLGAGVLFSTWPGLYVGMTGFVLANITQALWLYWRSRRVLTRLDQPVPAQ